MVDFPGILIAGVLVRRYKRFLADVRLEGPEISGGQQRGQQQSGQQRGQLVTAHVANTGAMTGCAEPGMRVWLSRSSSAMRKLPFSLELVEARPGVLASVNTTLANRLVLEAIENGTVQELAGYESIRPEARLGASRLDLLLSGPGRCWVEVKSVTLVEDGVAYFPDSKSVRGARHMRELREAARAGDRAAVFFYVGRGDAREVRPADHIDPEFGIALREAVAAGMEAIAYRAKVTARGVRLTKPLPVHLERTAED